MKSRTGPEDRIAFVPVLATSALVKLDLISKVVLSISAWGAPLAFWASNASSLASAAFNDTAVLAASSCACAHRSALNLLCPPQAQSAASSQ
jgi:hypothetical protein